MISIPGLRIDLFAEADISSAAIWYEERRQGLGLEFLDQLELIFKRIVEYPHQFPRIDESNRRALLGRFPYGIYFEFEVKGIVIRAVLHLHRSPEAWEKRKQDRSA